MRRLYIGEGRESVDIGADNENATIEAPRAKRGTSS